MAKEIIVSKEQAELEFSNFADEMDLDIDLDSMEAEDSKELEKIKEKMIKAIMYGSLTFNDKCEPVFTPQRSGDVSPLTFKEPRGSTLKCTDSNTK